MEDIYRSDIARWVCGDFVAEISHQLPGYVMVRHSDQKDFYIIPFVIFKEVVDYVREAFIGSEITTKNDGLSNLKDKYCGEQIDPVDLFKDLFGNGEDEKGSDGGLKN